MLQQQPLKIASYKSLMEFLDLHSAMRALSQSFPGSQYPVPACLCLPQSIQPTVTRNGERVVEQEKKLGGQRGGYYNSQHRQLWGETEMNRLNCVMRGIQHNKLMCISVRFYVHDECLIVLSHFCAFFVKLIYLFQHANQKFLLWELKFSLLVII